METKEIVNQTVWLKFFEENGSPSFLHSWEWGEIQKKLDYNVLRIGISDKGCLEAIALVVKIRSKRGDFLFVPHGPLINGSNIKNIIKALKEYLIEIAKQENFSFIRIASTLENNEDNRNIFEQLGFKKAPIYMHSENLWVLPLTESVYKTDEQLLASMRKTTRYLIRKAQKDGVTIEKRNDENAPDDFYKIYEETVRREKFVPFSKNYIKEEFEEFNKTGNVIFLFGGVKNTRLASALIIFTKSTAFYHQGASIHSKIPVTYLLQWEAIKEAKNRGCQFYNFWGIAPDENLRHPWAGLTSFKKGFGGKQINYLLTQDYIVSPKYYLTYVTEKIIRWKRGI